MKTQIPTITGSPDENSQSSLSSSPKTLSCPPTSHPNISPVDKSASSKFIFIVLTKLLYSFYMYVFFCDFSILHMLC